MFNVIGSGRQSAASTVHEVGRYYAIKPYAVPGKRRDTARDHIHNHKKVGDDQ